MAKYVLFQKTTFHKYMVQIFKSLIYPPYLDIKTLIREYVQSHSIALSNGVRAIQLLFPTVCGHLNDFGLYVYSTGRRCVKGSQKMTFLTYREAMAPHPSPFPNPVKSFPEPEVSAEP